MSAQESFELLKNFFETRQAARQAMNAIQEGVEIGLVIGDTIDCALIRRGESPVVERRTAVNPDVVFHIRPESVYVLNNRTRDDIGDIGVNVLKEILAGNINIKVPGKLLNLINRGYIDVIREGGAPVLAFLSQHGFASVTKIIASVKKMREDARTRNVDTKA